MVDAIADGGPRPRRPHGERGLRAVHGRNVSLLAARRLDRGPADRASSARCSAGGVLIVLGNSLLAVGRPTVFFLGLTVIVFGVGLLKPNVSAIVAQLYPEGGARRDAGFSIFYMGINLGAFVGSWLVPIVAAAYGWAAGFALPAVGMALGLVQFRLTQALPRRGRRGRAWPARRAGGRWRYSSRSFALLVVLALAGVLSARSGRDLHRRQLGDDRAARRLLRLPAAVRGPRSRGAKPRVGDGRACPSRARCSGRATSRPARRSTCSPNATRIETCSAGSMPAGVLQAVNPLFIIVFAPVFAALWVNLGRRMLEPVGAGQVRARSALPGRGVLRHVSRRREYVVAGRESAADLARADLSPAHVRRALPEPGRPELHDASSHRRASSARSSAFGSSRPRSASISPVSSPASIDPENVRRRCRVSSSISSGGA